MVKYVLLKDKFFIDKKLRYLNIWKVLKKKN